MATNLTPSFSIPTVTSTARARSNRRLINPEARRARQILDRAIEYLRSALNEGFTNPKKIVADSEFAGLRGLPAFEQLLAGQGNP